MHTNFYNEIETVRVESDIKLFVLLMVVVSTVTFLSLSLYLGGKIVEYMDAYADITSQEVKE